ncbi:hypothetical protein [Beijerinckia sp. L45]|uniref:hypothetical protein n=1 Tax=Beijerinckia sp. L45 TaxID=1641855 RepID=UPI00131BA1EC|nr:hypothetical protein [Beijerinckia sp. L45]
MTTNIANLPQLSGSFVVATNGDWRDCIQFQWPSGSTNAGQPIDVTGIVFEAQLRPSPTDSEVLLNMSTANGLLVNGGDMGTLTFAVPRDAPTTGLSDHMSNLPAGTTCAMDIVATGDGQIINLCQVGGPLSVTVNRGITRP